MNALAWLALAGALAWVLPARAASTPNAAVSSAALELVSPALDDCPERAALAPAIERRLGRRVFLDRPPELVLRVGFERNSASGYRARIALYDAEGRSRGERVLSDAGKTCRELEPSVVLVLALLLDSPPDPVTPPPEPPPPAPPAALEPPPPEQRTTSRPGNRGAPPARAAWRMDASLGAVGGHAQGPLAAGLRAGIGLEPPWAWLVRAEITRWFDAEDEIEGTGAGARSSALGLSLLVCPMRRWQSPQAWVCTGPRSDFVEVEGFGFEDARSTQVRALGAEARVGGAITLVGSLRLRGAAGVLFALRRPEVRYRTADGPTETLTRAPWVAGELELGLGLDFPAL